MLSKRSPLNSLQWKLDAAFSAYKCISAGWEQHAELVSLRSLLLIEEKWDALSVQGFLLNSLLGFFMSGWGSVPAVQHKTER